MSVATQKLWPLLVLIALCSGACGRRPAQVEDANAGMDRPTPPPVKMIPRGGSLAVHLGGSMAKFRVESASLFVGDSATADRIEIQGDGLYLSATLDDGNASVGPEEKVQITTENDIVQGSVVGKTFLVSSSEAFPDTLFAPPDNDQMDVVGGRIVVTRYDNGEGSPNDGWDARIELDLRGPDGVVVGCEGKIAGGITLTF